MKNKVAILLIFLLVSLLPVSAEDRLERAWWPSELRLGWGDQLFETLCWHPRTVVTTMPEDWNSNYQENFTYYQHLFIEYQWRPNRWLGFGGMVDGSGVKWDNVTRDGKGKELNRVKNEHFYNIVVMPTVRFTYFWHEYVNLYSGLGLGVDVNGGSEKDFRGRNTTVGVAFNLTLLGLQTNYKRFFAFVELGGMYALQNTNAIYMASSRKISAGIGCHF